MLKRQCKKSIVAGFMLLFLGVFWGGAFITEGTAAETVEKKTLRIGSSKEGTAGYTTLIAFSRVIDLKAPPYTKSTAVATAGATANIRLLDRGEVDVAYTNTLDMIDAVTNTGQFKKGGVKRVGYTGLFYSSAVVAPPVVLKKRKDINKLADLAGKKLSVSPGTGLYPVYKEIFSRLGVWDKFKQVQMPMMEVAQELNARALDFVITYLRSSGMGLSEYMAQIDQICDIKMINWSDEEIDKLKGIRGCALQQVYPSKVFKNPGMPEKVMGVGVPYGFFFAPWLEEVHVYNAVKALCENTDEIIKLEPVTGKGFKAYWKTLTTGGIDSLQKNNLPVHPGAAKYLKEAGLWKEEWKIGKIVKR